MGADIFNNFPCGHYALSGCGGLGATSVDGANRPGPESLQSLIF